jgi:hypothetical protein
VSLPLPLTSNPDRIDVAPVLLHLRVDVRVCVGEEEHVRQRVSVTGSSGAGTRILSVASVSRPPYTSLVLEMRNLALSLFARPSMFIVPSTFVLIVLMPLFW